MPGEISQPTLCLASNQTGNRIRTDTIIFIPEAFYPNEIISDDVLLLRGFQYL